MIKNERQYQLTKKKVSEFQDTIESFIKENELQPTDLKQFQIDALKSQYEELKDQLRVYESLKSGHLCTVDTDSFHDIGKLLIQGRIARGWTQKDLGNILELKEQQIQRWEVNNYESASLATIYRVIEAIGVDINLGRVSLVRNTFELPPDIDKEKLFNAAIIISSRKSLFSLC